MKLLSVSLLLMLFSIGARAQGKAAAVAGNPGAAATADMLVLKETVFDFGKIPQGKPVTHVFEIVNGGSDSLKISNVQASCGCTTPEWDRNKTQAPGEKAVVSVGYNAAAEGAFSKPITITYNGNNVTQITIKGEVWKTPLTSAPENDALKSLKEE